MGKKKIVIPPAAGTGVDQNWQSFLKKAGKSRKRGREPGGVGSTAFFGKRPKTTGNQGYGTDTTQMVSGGPATGPNTVSRPVARRVGGDGAREFAGSSTAASPAASSSAPAPSDQARVDEFGTAANNGAVANANKKAAERLLGRKSTDKLVALDCEMIGVGDGGKESILARVAVVGSNGACLYDKHVLPQERVTDYRTKWSGVRRHDLNPKSGAVSFRQAQEDVARLIDGKMVVGHALKNDFAVLMLKHPRKLVRDTALYRPFQRAKRKPHALRVLAQMHLGQKIQVGEHSPVEDARAALQLYLMHEKQWERRLREKRERAREQTKARVLASRAEMVRQTVELTDAARQASSEAAVAAGWVKQKRQSAPQPGPSEDQLARLTRKERAAALAAAAASATNANPRKRPKKNKTKPTKKK